MNQAQKPRRISAIVLIVGCIGFLSAASTQQNTSFNWSITPYTFTGTANGAFVGEQHSKNDYYDALLGLRYRFDFRF